MHKKNTSFGSSGIVTKEWDKIPNNKTPELLNFH